MLLDGTGLDYTRERGDGGRGGGGEWMSSTKERSALQHVLGVVGMGMGKEVSFYGWGEVKMKRICSVQRPSLALGRGGEGGTQLSQRWISRKKHSGRMR